MPLTISALFLEQIEQSQVVSSGKSVVISNCTAPQWQLLLYVSRCLMTCYWLQLFGFERTKYLR